MRGTRWTVTVLATALVTSACGPGNATDRATEGALPSIVVTTSILGDVVASMVGDAAVVTVIMPPGASPHDFQPSARQARSMREADVLITNGAGFEEGLHAVLEAAEEDGVSVYEAISGVDVLSFDSAHESEDDQHDDAEDTDDEHTEDEYTEDEYTDDEHTGVDPHFFTDPVRMADAARGIVGELTRRVPALDTDEVRSRAEAYFGMLDALDTEVDDILAGVPAQDRVLVTNHEVFNYFADRHGFEVVGAVIPSGTTGEGANARDLDELTDVIEAAGVPAIFADTSSPDHLAQTLATEVGDIEVVELFSESLGDEGSGAESYVEMIRTNAHRIAAALS